MSSIYEQLSQIRISNPFTPFTLVLKDGRRFEIKRRLQYAFQPDRVVVVDARDLHDFFKTADVDHIEILQPAN